MVVIVYHTTLRRALARRGYAPRDLVAFLDYTSRLLLTQRSGGGYRFKHRIVQEYFAKGYQFNEE